MGASQRRSGASGRWLLLVAGTVTVLLSAAALFFWIAPDRVSPDGARAPAGTPLPVPTADPRAVALELAAVAPELTLASAEMLARAMPSASGAPLAEIGLLFASRGFELMERSERLEVGQLFEEVYAGLPAPDRDWMGEYTRLLRAGDLTPEASVRGRRLLTQGVSLMPPERRARLQALVEKSIQAALEARRKAESRTPPAPPAVVQFQPFAPMPPNSPPAEPAAIVPASSPGPGASDVKDEAYWRSRMREARARVARLKRRADGLEADVRAHTGSASLAQRSRIEELARARAELAAAEQAIVEAEEEARKLGALPGWLRE
jgi:hypothetical protein